MTRTVNPWRDSGESASHSAESRSAIKVITRSNDHMGRGTEIRVHGVGDHADFSALGKPGFEDRRKSQVLICDAPPLPRHRLLLVGWSRANRKLTRTFLWYLLFPFTLINVAGYMGPKDHRYEGLLRKGIQLTSFVLTVALAAWISVIVETVWQGVTDPPVGWAMRLVVAFSGPAVVAAVIGNRLWRGDRAVNRAGSRCSVVHLAGLLLLALVSCFAPATWPSWIPAAPDQDRLVDPMAYVVYGSTALVAIAALLLSVAAVTLRVRPAASGSDRDSSSLAGAALLLVIAASVLHTGGSLLRLFAFHLTGLLQDIRHATEGAQWRGGVLLPWDEDLGEALRMDLLLGLFAMFALILTASLLVAAIVNSSRAGDRTASDVGLRPASVWHRVLQYAPSCFSLIVFATVLITTIGWVAMCFALETVERREVLVSRSVFAAVGAVLIVFLVVRRPERAGEWIKRIFQMIADIAGFWSPRWAPLAGASYRSVIEEALDAAVAEADDGEITLVGHSQGSVICAWYLSRLDRQQQRITLFTCGSPLRSLYSTFFPIYFGSEFFESVAATSAGGRWFNYWRLTDPIATDLPDALNRDLTERRDQPLRGHGEYWQEPCVRRDVENALSGAGMTDPPSPSSPRIAVGQGN